VGGAAAVPGDPVAAGPSSRENCTAAKTPPAISSVTAASAPIRTTGRRPDRFAAGGAPIWASAVGASALDCHGWAYAGSA
jgi:hypothetical protein